MGLIRRTFTYLNEHSFKYLFQALDRPHLEYAAAVWSPYKQHDIVIDSIENVQRRATKQIPSLNDMEYPDRLKKLKMPTLKYRRLRGDMIETFKIITGIYDNEVTEGIFDLDPNTRTRGHSKKIKKKFCKINLRKFSFTNRIVDLWNTLPQSVIDAKDARQFEIRLNKYWEHQDVKFEYKASIQNTGNHTKISCITE
jgi:hypothetical protein